MSRPESPSTIFIINLIDFNMQNINLKSSFIPVDRETLQHLKYPNVFGWGDIVNLPCSKTAAAAFAQVPVVVHNLCQYDKKLPLSGKYDGYASCPLFVGDNKLMLAEFLYDGVPAESFSNKQDVPLKAFYYMKKEMLIYYYNFINL